MISKFSRFAVYAITILIANYLSDLFFQKLNLYKSPNYLTVLYGMGILIIVYVPCFTILEKYLKKAAKSYVKGSKSMTKNSSQGLLIGLFVAFLILFYLYANLWIQRDLVQELLSVFR